MVYLLCDLQGLTRYNVAEVKMKLLINPRESQAQPQVSQVYCLCDRLCLSILSVANFSTIVYWKKIEIIFRAAHWSKLACPAIQRCVPVLVGYQYSHVVVPVLRVSIIFSIFHWRSSDQAVGLPAESPTTVNLAALRLTPPPAEHQFSENLSLALGAVFCSYR